MSGAVVSIRELAAWGLDEYEYRPSTLRQDRLAKAGDLIAQRAPFKQRPALVQPQPQQSLELLRSHASRPALLAEMSTLPWSLGAVDLRSLVAFQRRLVFSPDEVAPSVPSSEDWPRLVDFSFAPPKSVEYEFVHDSADFATHDYRTFLLRSSNPGFHLRFTGDCAFPWSAHGGGPFMEVAHFRDRWFLRDGYHRAYRLLQAQVHVVPVITVRCATLGELGAVEPWFFSEETLFSSKPPLVTDFLDDDLVVEYERPQLIKTVRVTIQEDLRPSPGEQP